ncbi:MAG TPA: MOSC N-terminal beta barrel domain-containing protein [Jatrophihabitans sp.]|jgi:hypothetical protein|uniref:MOSC domain-containing protein n=1 Tax=Jatrophihabitans sp. TaxID=1932789 RepID=UPI002E026EA2|nr:MOSC N-terminal beta barrel domain-containing protein [Jatrophihabitans sp.]
MPLHLTSINRYPVKSCRGEAVTSADVEPWGLAGDRRWMLVDDEGVLITAREHPRLLLVTPRITEGGLAFTSPDADDLQVTVPTSTPEPVRVHRSTVSASVAAADANAWFSAIIGTPARLVHLGDPTQRALNPRFAQPTDRVSLADGYPLMATSSASLDALNDLIAEGPRADEGPVPMMRFRPSLVVDGATAWAEDGWRRLRIGAAEFRVVKGCDRCVMTTIDPDTAAKGKEPVATLARHRRFDGATWFGMQLIPDTPGATIRVGDDVEVVESVPAPDGPPR